MQTDPKYKGRGAGSMLTKACLDEAREMDMRVFLESSEEAHNLYVKMGFNDVEEHSLDMSKWGLQSTHRTWAMTWEPRAL
jgi:N-acetylglutamate synthase-like GNAT family acetyltransferase